MNVDRLRDSAWAVRCVWLRYFSVFSKDLKYALLTTFAEPILYLISFGYGLGGLIGKIQIGETELTYRQFVLGGIVAQTILFQGFFEGSYGSFIRMYYQRIFKAMATTPVTLAEVLWGELLWDATKGTFSASAVLLIGCGIGDFSVRGALLALPVCYLGALLFSSLGLWMSALSESIEQINYPQYILIFPMFLYCGVYFPLERMPELVRHIAWALPLTPLLSIIRGLVLGTALNPWAGLLLGLWLLGFLFFSRRAMTARLIK